MSLPVTIGPFNKALVVVPDNALDFAPFADSPGMPTLRLFVGGAGVVAAVFPNGSVVNFTCVAGQQLDLALRRVNLTNTTATLMVALYSV